jgi:hypothetical protein
MQDLITADIFVEKPTLQTLSAWEPFWECVGILFSLQHTEVVDGDDELPEWRQYWTNGIVLLRTVGHVLDKVDARKSQINAKILNDFWLRLKANRETNSVFWEFIDRERNNILKTYSFGAKLEKDDQGDYQVLTDNGEDAFELYRYAVYWWRKQLVDIEAELAR